MTSSSPSNAPHMPPGTRDAHKKNEQDVVYILEDESAILTLLSETLREYGFETQSYSSGKSFLQAFTRRKPDLCLLDLGLPDIDGMALIEKVRVSSAVPIIILSGRDHATDRILALESGADDYVTKPFEPREIVARARSVLRRSVPQPAQHQEANEVEFAGWRFQPQSQSLTDKNGHTSFLSVSEADLLLTLLRSANRVASREHLLENDRHAMSIDRSIDVRISRLRKKLEGKGGEPQLIRTIYGAGYMLTAKVNWIS